jgi:hypothetical protein
LPAVVLALAACGTPPAPRAPRPVVTEDGAVRVEPLSGGGWACSSRRENAPGRASSFAFCGLHDGSLLLVATAAPVSNEGDGALVTGGADVLRHRHAQDFGEVRIESSREIVHQGHRGYEITFTMVDGGLGPFRILDRVWIAGGVVCHVTVRGTDAALSARREVVERWLSAVRFAALEPVVIDSAVR